MRQSKTWPSESRVESGAPVPREAEARAASAGFDHLAACDDAEVRKMILQAHELPYGRILLIEASPGALQSLVEFVVRRVISPRLPRVSISVDQGDGRCWVRPSGAGGIRKVIANHFIYRLESRREGDES